jgi:NAD-specific glutamate dehydrogenase
MPGDAFNATDVPAVEAILVEALAATRVEHRLHLTDLGLVILHFQLEVPADLEMPADPGAIETRVGRVLRAWTLGLEVELEARLGRQAGGIVFGLYADGLPAVYLTCLTTFRTP